MKKETGTGLQTNLFGQPVHILNVKEIYRTVKCGECGHTVKSSKAKTHLSFGNTLTLCEDCLKRRHNTSRPTSTTQSFRTEPVSDKSKQ